MWIKLMVVLLPWKLKRWILQAVYKYKLHPTARIGFSYVFPKYLEMGENARIGHLNCVIHLDRLQMGANSIISRGNWVTGFPAGTDSRHFAHRPHRRCELILGKESSITKKHHIDCTDAVIIGDFVTVGGYASQFLTHSVDIRESRQDCHPISIGDYCFIGTGVKILGGSVLPARSVLGAGAVLNKRYEKEWTVYAGVPARPVKEIDETAKYFHRESGFIY